MVSAKTSAPVELPIMGRGDTVHPTRSEQIKQLIGGITSDIGDINSFYEIDISRARVEALIEFFSSKQVELTSMHAFEELDTAGRIDWTMLERRCRYDQRRYQKRLARINLVDQTLGPWVQSLVLLCEQRQRGKPGSPEEAAKTLEAATSAVSLALNQIGIEKAFPTIDRFAVLATATELRNLWNSMVDWYSSSAAFDPSFRWWAAAPFEELTRNVEALIHALRTELVGAHPRFAAPIVGLPMGRDGLERELAAGMIAYSPDELIRMLQQYCATCEEDAMRASRELGFGNDWRKATEHVQTIHVDPGRAHELVHDLAREAIEFVARHDMITVPPIATRTWRTRLVGPTPANEVLHYANGAVNVVCPMHEMVDRTRSSIMKFNCRPWTRVRAVRALIPGCHLQNHYQARHNQHRELFSDPCWRRGWRIYWDILLQQRGFYDKPEDRLAMRSLHMQECALMVAVLNFDLGQMMPQRCVNYVADKTGRNEEEVERDLRSYLNQDRHTLDLLGGMVGGLQLTALRREVVETGFMNEREFHDRVLKEGPMPIEFLRTLVLQKELTADPKPAWRFFDLKEEDRHEQLP